MCFAFNVVQLFKAAGWLLIHTAEEDRAGEGPCCWLCEVGLYCHEEDQEERFNASFYLN